MVKNDIPARKEVSSSPLIIAHRGASANAPENTLAAIRMAVDAGADGVEFDVQLASDGVPVVIHDPTLDRTALRTGKVSRITSKELGEIDIGSWFNSKYPTCSNPDFAKETIPTLTQVLQTLGTFHGWIYIELKPNAAKFQGLIEAVCDTVRNSPLLSQMIFKSFDLTAIPEIKQLIPNSQTAALFGVNLFNILRQRKQIITIALQLGVDHISLHHSMVTRQLALRAADSQLPLTIWTTDKPKWLARCQELGIRALITNDPSALLECRNEIRS